MFRALCIKPTAPNLAVRGLGTLLRCSATQFDQSHCSISTRQFTTTSLKFAEHAEKDPKSSSGNVRVKEYKELPGPWTIPFLGISPEMMKVDPKRSIQTFATLPEKYGKLFKVKAAPGLAEFVCVFDPEDAKHVFRSEGKYPQRTPLEIWEDSRLKQGKPLGMLFLKGPEWHRQRTAMAKFMSVPRKVVEYHEPFNNVTADLVANIRRKRDKDNMFIDVASELQLWAFESINVFLLGKRMGSLDETIPPDCQEFIDQIYTFLSSSHKILFGLPLHKIYPTQDYKSMMSSFGRIFEISMALIKEKLDEIDHAEIDQSDDGPPLGMDFITYMSKADKMSLEMITTNAIDLMGAGVDTTSTTLLWALYCLAVNPEIQSKVRQEVTEAVGGAKVVTPAHIQHMPYLKTCIKESMRLYAVAPNNTRVLDKEIVLGGYKIPAGTSLLMPTVPSGLQEYNFSEPEKFIPERWSRDNKNPPNPFASLPFGFGARMCVGRRLAELELHIGLAQLITNYTIEFRDPQPMDYVQNLFLSPERRLDLAFIDNQ